MSESNKRLIKTFGSLALLLFAMFSIFEFARDRNFSRSKELCSSIAVGTSGADLNRLMTRFDAVRIFQAPKDSQFWGYAGFGSVCGCDVFFQGDAVQKVFLARCVH